MKVLLASTNRVRSPQTLVPLGVCYVASAAESAGHDVHLLDLCFSRQPVTDVEAEVRRIQPDIIGLSVRNLDNCDSLRPNSYLPEARQIVDACRRNSGAEIVLGGPAVSESPREVARHLGCKFAVMGEGEIAFPRLLQAIEHGEDLNSVPGIIVADETGDIAHPNSPVDLMTLSDPRPDRWLDLQTYAASDASLPVQTKRGCPFSCNYCSCPLLEGATFRLREPEWVVEQAAAAKTAGMRGVEFVDSVFGFPQEHSIACVEAIGHAGLGIPMSTLELNPLACTGELADAMDAVEFSVVGITAESASDAVLDRLNKGFMSDDLRRAERNLRRLRARKLWIFMFGGPGETEKTVRETAGFIESLPHTDLVLITHGIRVLPMTALRDELVDEGLIGQDDKLLEPRFYYSPHVTPRRANEILAESSFPRNNMVTLTDCAHPLAPVLQRLAAMLGMRPPYWRGLPVINRARRLLRI